MTLEIITEWLKLEGISGHNLVHSPPAEAGTYSARSRWLLNIPKEETPQCLWASCVSASSLAQHRSPLLLFIRNPLCSSLCPLHLLLELGFIFFASSLQVFLYIDEMPTEPHLLQVGQPQLSWSFFTKQSSALSLQVPQSTLSSKECSKNE